MNQKLVGVVMLVTLLIMAITASLVVDGVLSTSVSSSIYGCSMLVLLVMYRSRNLSWQKKFDRTLTGADQLIKELNRPKEVFVKLHGFHEGDFYAVILMKKDGTFLPSEERLLRPISGLKVAVQKDILGSPHYHKISTTEVVLLDVVYSIKHQT